MARFVSKRDVLRADWQSYPKPKPSANAPGAGKRKRRELLIYDVKAEGKYTVSVRTRAPAITFTEWSQHAALSHTKGLSIFGHAAGIQRKDQRCKRWGTK